MGASNSTGAKLDRLAEVMKRYYGPSSASDQKGGGSSFPRVAFVNETKFVIAELSEEEVLFMGPGGTNIFPRNEWVDLFGVLKRQKLVPHAIVSCRQPATYMVRSEFWDMYLVNVEKNIWRRVSSGRGLLVDQYLVRIEGRNVVITDAETSETTILQPFFPDPFLTHCWLTGITAGGSGLRLLMNAGSESVLEWTHAGKNIPIPELPALVRQGVTPSPSLRNLSDQPQSADFHAEITDALKQAMPGAAWMRSVVKPRSAATTVVCAWELNSRGKKLVALVRDTEAVLMLCRPQLQYSQFLRFAK